MFKVVKRKELNFWEKIYIPEIMRGMFVTGKHFFKNLLNWKRMPTIQYPEIRYRIPDRLRGRHRLTTKDDGSLRCTSCFLCATACPSNCIYITAGEHDDPSVEKYPVEYKVDISKCVFCGFCVEACPCDAIRMDAGIDMTTSYERYKLLCGIDYLRKEKLKE